MNGDNALTPFLAASDPQGVKAAVVAMDGAPALRLALAPARRNGQLGVDFGDEPAFLVLPDRLATGMIDVDLMGRLLPDAPDHAHGFIGLAFRLGQDGFENVCLRPTNGRALALAPPRDLRAVQYFAWPDWIYDRLRARAPGRYEAGADIAPGRWHRLQVRIGARDLRAFVDGAQVLHLEPPLGLRAGGRVGLWVDIGTEGWFRAARSVAD